MIGLLFESVSRRGRPIPIIESSGRSDAEVPGPRQMYRYLVRLNFLAPPGFGVYGYARADPISSC